MTLEAIHLTNSSRKYKREGTDFYPTPPDVTTALLRELPIKERDVIWECACGDGLMTKTIKKEGIRGTNKCWKCR